jgi:hypothetical protein
MPSRVQFTKQTHTYLAANPIVSRIPRLHTLLNEFGENSSKLATIGSKKAQARRVCGYDEDQRPNQSRITCATRL